MENKNPERSRLYKNSNKDGDELRRRRKDESVELRKAKKDDQLFKRRNVADEVAGGELEDSFDNGLKDRTNAALDLPDYDEICQKIMNSTDPSIKFQYVQICRKALSRERQPPIDEFFKRGIVPELVACLSKYPDRMDLIFEASWALTNIASSDTVHTQAVVNCGAVEPLIRLLNSSNINIAEQSVWALGNIAGDGASYRDHLIKAGIIKNVTILLETVWHVKTVVANITWLMSNLVRNKNPPPSSKAVGQLLPFLGRLLSYGTKANDLVGTIEVVQDAAWAFSYVTDSINDQADNVIKAGVVPRLIQLLCTNEISLITPALRALGNLVTGTDDQTQFVVDCGVLQALGNLLCHSKSTIVKETCWFVSNITAGTQGQIQAVTDANLVPKLIDILQNADFKSQKEACWAVSNFINGGNEQQISYLVNNGAVPVLCQMLTITENKVVIIVLESIKRILELARTFDQEETICTAIETCGGLDKLEALQDHENEQVYVLAYGIIDKFFSGTDEANDDTSKADLEDAEANEAEAQYVKFVASNNPTERFEF